MRLFFFLAAVIITVLDATRTNELYDLPNGFPDGTLITIYFKHNSAEDFLWMNGEKDHIRFSFYDWRPRVENGQLYNPANIPAFLRIERGWEETVYSDTQINNEWQAEVVKKQANDGYPPTEGWWRVDVMKVDKYRLNVFFQGFWAGVRMLDLPLDNIIAFHMDSKDIHDKNNIEVHYKYPNKDLIPPTFDQFTSIIHSDYDNVPRKIITLPGLPLDNSIELVAVMRASGEAKHRKPVLDFRPVDGSPFFLKMTQEWSDETQKLWISTNEGFSNGGKATRERCTFDWSKPNGDLVHLKMTRIRFNIVEVRVLYKKTEIHERCKNEQALCWMYIPDELTASLDRPFDIVGTQGAMLLHINRSYPDQFPPSSSANNYFYNSREGHCVGGQGFLNLEFCYCINYYKLDQYYYANCEKSTREGKC